MPSPPSSRGSSTRRSPWHDRPSALSRDAFRFQPAPWNQMLRLNRLSPAIPVTQLPKNQNYKSAAIPPGPAPWNQNTCSKPPSLEFQVTQANHTLCDRFNLIPLGRSAPQAQRSFFFALENLRVRNLYPYLLPRKISLDISIFSGIIECRNLQAPSHLSLAT